MTANNSDDREIFEIMQYMETELRRDADMRQELAAAVRRKDDSAIRKVAHAVWQGIKAVAPYAFSAVLAFFGIPSTISW